MPPSFDAANARHRLLRDRTDAALPDLVLMLLQSIRDSQDAAEEADASSHLRRALSGNPQPVGAGTPQPRPLTMDAPTQRRP